VDEVEEYQVELTDWFRARDLAWKLVGDGRTGRWTFWYRRGCGCQRAIFFDDVRAVTLWDFQCVGYSFNYLNPGCRLPPHVVFREWRDVRSFVTC
jgi:hypothetical protein